MTRQQPRKVMLQTVSDVPASTSLLYFFAEHQLLTFKPWAYGTKFFIEKYVILYVLEEATY